MAAFSGTNPSRSSGALVGAGSADGAGDESIESGVGIEEWHFGVAAVNDVGDVGYGDGCFGNVCGEYDAAGACLNFLGGAG